MTLLELKDVTRRFGGVTAVDRCSFSVAAGSLTGLIGPNGAGKTTVFNLIAGFVKPDAGEIELGGRRLGRLRPHQITRLGLSRTFQITRELKDLTVLENVVIHAPTRSLGDMFRSAVRKAERERAMSLLDLVGLARFADAPARGLSFGQKKLLELAAALMPEPKLILLDEPAAGVNPALLDAIVGYIEQVNQDGVTFLIVEHNMDLVMNLCDPVIVMAAGKVLAHGSPAQIQNDSRVLEAYLGEGAPLPPPRATPAEWEASTILASPSRSSLPLAAARVSESLPAAARVSEPAAAGASAAAPEPEPAAIPASISEAVLAVTEAAVQEPKPRALLGSAAVPASISEAVLAAAEAAVSESEPQAVPGSAAVPASISEAVLAAVGALEPAAEPEAAAEPEPAAAPEAESEPVSDAVPVAATIPEPAPAPAARPAPESMSEAVPVSEAAPAPVRVPNKSPRASKASKTRSTNTTSAKAKTAEGKSTKANTAKARSVTAKAAKTAGIPTRKTRTATGSTATAKPTKARSAKAKSSKTPERD